MSASAHFAPRLFNTPVALHPDYASTAVALLADYFAGARTGGMLALAELAAAEPDIERYRPYCFVDGIAIIPIRGTLVQCIGSLWWAGEYTNVSGYDHIRRCFLDALGDDQVEAIVLDVDSPGGDVAGFLDLADTIFDARGIKPIWGILGENAYSAAYGLVSSADPGRIYVPRTGGTGSIGAIYMHLSYAGALEKQGVEPTIITKGKFKGDASDLKALEPTARKRIQADIDAVGDLFDQLVARNRGLKVKEVAATEAATFMGAEGVDLGLADHVMAPDAAIYELRKFLG